MCHFVDGSASVTTTLMYFSSWMQRAGTVSLYCRSEVVASAASVLCQLFILGDFFSCICFKCQSCSLKTDINYTQRKEERSFMGGPPHWKLQRWLSSQLRYWYLPWGMSLLWQLVFVGESSCVCVQGVSVSVSVCVLCLCTRFVGTGGLGFLLCPFYKSNFTVAFKHESKMQIKLDLIWTVIVHNYFLGAVASKQL